MCWAYSISSKHAPSFLLAEQDNMAHEVVDIGLVTSTTNGLNGLCLSAASCRCLGKSVFGVIHSHVYMEQGIIIFEPLKFIWVDDLIPNCFEVAGMTIHILLSK